MCRYTRTHVLYLKRGHGSLQHSDPLKALLCQCEREREMQLHYSSNHKYYCPICDVRMYVRMSLYTIRTYVYIMTCTYTYVHSTHTHDNSVQTYILKHNFCTHIRIFIYNIQMFTYIGMYKCIHTCLANIHEYVHTVSYNLTFRWSCKLEDSVRSDQVKPMRLFIVFLQ